MLGINFEKSNRPKDQERKYIQKEIETYNYPDYLDDFSNQGIETDKLAGSSIRSAGFYNNKNRLNIEKEIENVMSMSPGPEKDRTFFELKENFLWQQKGLAVLKDQLFKEIGDGDTINLEKINEIITENDKIYNFSCKQMLAIQKMTRDFLRKNQIVNYFYNTNFKNPNKIYQQFYNAQPIGKIELHKGLVSLDFICDNKDDYARIYENDNSGRRNLEEKEKKDADATAGFFSWSSPVGFSELKGTIVGVKKSEYNDTDQIIVHEEQHAINKIYEDNIFYLEKENFSSALYFCNNKEKMENIISSYCHYLIARASERAKNEILAFKTGDLNDNEIIRILTQNKKMGGIYDYFDFDKTIKSIETISQNGVLKQYQDELLDSAKKILKDKYKILIKNGIAAVNLLKNKGYSKASITAILMPQALKNWLKAAERAKLSNNYSGTQNKLNDIISSDGVENLQDFKKNLLEQ